eukprot:365256-Chlamydomonas_euryale.AAC.8
MSQTTLAAGSTMTAAGTQPLCSLRCALPQRPTSSGQTPQHARRRCRGAPALARLEPTPAGMCTHRVWPWKAPGVAMEGAAGRGLATSDMQTCGGMNTWRC